ncbi:MAG: protease modulator HflK N-terminal domain-containing protein, partial [Tepidimonas sp.]|nr:protease modulator HflK N-terminal domain-containing protein [Tepidimonas sp.]
MNDHTPAGFDQGALRPGPHVVRQRPWWRGLRAVFNLHDPRWGRGDEDGSDDARRPRGSSQQPPDLDELWRDFNRKLGGLFGGRGGRGDGGRG